MNASLLLSSPNYGVFVHAHLDDVPDWEQHATVVLDIPNGYALEQLDRMSIRERRLAIVLTPGTHPAYHDVLASYTIRQVVPMHNDTALGIMRLLIKDDHYKPTFQPALLTKSEARTLRYILRGWSTEATATALGLRPTTIHDYVSNAGHKIGTSSRAELIAAIMAVPTSVDAELAASRQEAAA